MALTLTVTDNGNGTVAFTVDGDGSTADVYRCVAGGDWELSTFQMAVGTSVNFTLADGSYFFYAVDDLNQLSGVTARTRVHDTTSNTQPTIEQIADELVTRLQAITTGNSYAFTVPSVVRPDRVGTITHTDYLVTVEQTETERNDDLTRASSTGLQIAWNTTFQITCFLRPTDTDTTALDQLGNIALTELTRGICDDASWWTFDQHAIDATFTGHEHFNDENGAGVRLMLRVTYRTDEADPRTERL